MPHGAKLQSKIMNMLRGWFADTGDVRAEQRATPALKVYYVSTLPDLSSFFVDLSLPSFINLQPPLILKLISTSRDKVVIS